MEILSSRRWQATRPLSRRVYEYMLVWEPVANGYTPALYQRGMETGSWDFLSFMKGRRPDILGGFHTGLTQDQLVEICAVANGQLPRRPYPNELCQLCGGRGHVPHEDAREVPCPTCNA